MIQRYSLVYVIQKLKVMCTPSTHLNVNTVCRAQDIRLKPDRFLHALPSLPHTPRNTSGYGFPSTPTSCLLFGENVFRQVCLSVCHMIFSHSFQAIFLNFLCM